MIAADNTTYSLYQQTGWDPFQHPVTSTSGTVPLATNARCSHLGQTHSGLSKRDSRPPISVNQPIITEWSLHPEIVNRIYRTWGTPKLDMFATIHNTHLPQFKSPIPEPRALAGRSMYMFLLFPLLSKVIQKFRTTQEGEVILIAPWWPSQPWFPHLLRLCVWTLASFHTTGSYCHNRDMSRTASHTICRHVALMHYQAARFSKEVSRLTAAPRRPSTNRMYNDSWLRFTHWAAGQGIDPLGPTAAQIAAFLYYLFDTHGLSPQTIKGSCLASVFSRTGNAAAVQAKTISDMITSMELQRPRMTLVLPQWDLGIVLEAL